MPIKESAKKALRQNKKRRNRNTRRKRAFKKLRKQMEEFLSQKQNEKAKALFPKYQKALDKAAKTGAIHANKAARLKSRLSRKLNSE